MPTNRKQSVFAEDSTLLDTAFLPFLDLLQPVLDDRNRKISYLNFKTQLLAALGASPVIITTTLWVDNTPGQGDDGTAERGDVNKKYATIGAALTDAQDGDAVYVIGSGISYVENLTKTIANTSNFSIIGIGIQRPIIASTSGTTLAVVNGYWQVKNIIVESTSSTITDSVFTLTGSNQKIVLIDCDILANGNSRILTNGIYAVNCYFASGGNNTLLSTESSEFRECYFKQPDTSTYDCIITNTRIIMDKCWVDGGLIGVSGGGGFAGTMTMNKVNMFNSPKNIVARRDVYLTNCSFISTSTFECVGCGFNVGTISTIIGCLFHNTSTATNAILNIAVGPSTNINGTGNFYSQTNLSNTPLLVLGNNFNSLNMNIVGTDSANALDYFTKRT